MLGGDIHSLWTNDLKLVFDDPSSKTIVIEFVGKSITSNPPPYDVLMKFMSDNPHIRFFESRVRGYCMVQLTPSRMTTHFRTVSDATDPKSTVGTLASWVVKDGRPGAQKA